MFVHVLLLMFVHMFLCSYVLMLFLLLLFFDCWSEISWCGIRVSSKWDWSRFQAKLKRVQVESMWELMWNQCDNNDVKPMHHRRDCTMMRLMWNRSEIEMESNQHRSEHQVNSKWDQAIYAPQPHEPCLVTPWAKPSMLHATAPLPHPSPIPFPLTLSLSPQVSRSDPPQDPPDLIPHAQLTPSLRPCKHWMQTNHESDTTKTTRHSSAPPAVISCMDLTHHLPKDPLLGVKKKEESHKNATKDNHSAVMMSSSSSVCCYYYW